VRCITHFTFNVPHAFGLFFYVSIAQPQAVMITIYFSSCFSLPLAVTVFVSSVSRVTVFVSSVSRLDIVI